jgi:hypothetical protein
MSDQEGKTDNARQGGWLLSQCCLAKRAAGDELRRGEMEKEWTGL